MNKEELGKLLQDFLKYKGKELSTGGGVLRSRETEMQITILLTELSIWLQGGLDGSGPSQNIIEVNPKSHIYLDSSEDK